MLDLRCSILDPKDASGYRTRFQKYPFSTTVLIKSVETAWIFFRFRFKKSDLCLRFLRYLPSLTLLHEWVNKYLFRLW